MSCIIFYHPNSEACNKFKSILPKDKEYKFINVETLNIIPKEVDSVPCLIVDDNKIYKGKDAFDYFSRDNEMECISLCGKHSTCSYSVLENESSIESTEKFSTINDDGMLTGVPTYDENQSNKNLDEITAQRASEFGGVKRE